MSRETVTNILQALIVAVVIGLTNSVLQLRDAVSQFKQFQVIQNDHEERLRATEALLAQRAVVVDQFQRLRQDFDEHIHRHP